MDKRINDYESEFDEKNRQSIVDWSERAIRRAKDFGVDFNYQSNDIVELEKILEDLFLAKERENLDDDFLWRWSCVFGSYLGETIIRNSYNGHRWAIVNKSKNEILNSDVPVLISNTNYISTPIDKVYKRLKNGKEDDVELFYKDVLLH